MSAAENTNEQKETFKVVRYEQDEKVQPVLSFKVILIGNVGVGKSCLSLKATKGEFVEEHFSTVGFDFFPFYAMSQSDSKLYSLQIWDTCGQEGYKSLIQNFYRSTSLAVLVYSITDRESFTSIEKWVKELKTYASPDIKLFLIGNKCDLEDHREVSKELGEKMRKELKFDLFMETSAKTGINSEEMFLRGLEMLYEDYAIYSRNISQLDNDDSRNEQNSNRITIRKDKHVLQEIRGNKKKKCC